MLANTDASQEPYRATKLWNEVVRLFRCGMPTKRHWYQLKVFHDTFSGAEATDWLHDCLKQNTNFGTQVTREQTIRLLCKFLKNHVIEDLNGKWGSEDVTDNKQLYRFPQRVSPSKAIRQPLALLDMNVLSPRRQNIADAKKRFIQQQSQMSKKKTNSKAFANVWHRTYLSSLQQVLNLKSIEEVLPCGILQMEWLIHNVTKDELSTFTEHEMPYWVISAMQCLATWPNSESSGLPSYPGFERDIFAAVCGYFQALTEPLLTYNLYQFFITVFVRSEKMSENFKPNIQESPQASEESEGNDTEEVEKLRRRLMQAQMRHANKAIRHRKSIRLGAIPTKYRNFNEVEIPSSRKMSSWNILVSLRFNDDYPISIDCQNNANKCTISPEELIVVHIRDWGPGDLATRQIWTERFSSFQKLDQLVEENSILEQSKRENFASLPELRFSTLPRKMPKSADSEFSTDYETRNENIYNFQGDNHGIEDEFRRIDMGDVEKSASVENLLLDMSYRMQSEMENELMKDNSLEGDDFPISGVKGHLKGYENLSYDEQKDVMQSPMYQTMKPVYQKNKNVSQNTRYQNSTALKKCQSFNARGNYNTNYESEDVYMEISASQPDLNVKIKSGQQCLMNLQQDTNTFDPMTSTIQRQKNTRNSIKPSIEDLENNLMFSPCVKNARPIKWNDYVKKSQPRRIITASQPRSDIIERREVPPPCVTDKAMKNNTKVVQKRLPYVSQPMATRPMNAVSQPNCGISRSYSTLTHRPQRDQGQQNSSRPKTALSQRCGWNKPLLPTAIAKSCNNFSEVLMQHDRPPSPLTTAFDTARTQANPGLETSSRIVESLQLCLLLLPPSNRSKLRLLLRLMVKMCDNPHLADLHDLLPTRSYILQELSTCIIRHDKVSKSPSNNEVEAKIMNVLLDHTSVIMSKPSSLDVTVKELMSQQSKSQSCINTVGLAPDVRKPLKRQSTFCKQVSVADYEKQRRNNLEQSLTQLLYDIVNNENMTLKEKRKKLKQFQKSYPEIYEAAYPDADPVLERRSSSGRKKFSTAIKRLRSLRL